METLLRTRLLAAETRDLADRVSDLERRLAGTVGSAEAAVAKQTCDQLRRLAAHLAKLEG